MQQLGADDPRWIGGYRLLGRLGEGGMGRVYLARSERGRTVAVKLVRSELASRSDFRERFAQEVAAAQRVGGRWTAPVLDADTAAANPWFATGYIGGPSLEAVVEHDHGPLPERSVLHLADGLAHALEDIHTAGLVHRDLKPANVLITVDGPRVIDFGIARSMETLAGGALTATGAVIGSPGFMSPEQVRGERVTAASDIFCLGSVLAFAATGRQPFGSIDSGMHALMYRIAEAEPDLTGLPERLHALVSGCLAKDPAERLTLAEVSRLTGQGLAEGRSPGDAPDAEPWLPGGLLARLGREALQLLDVESPQAPAPPASERSHRSAALPDPRVPGPRPVTPVPQLSEPVPPPPGLSAASMLPPHNAPYGPAPLSPGGPYGGPGFRLPTGRWTSPRGLAVAASAVMGGLLLYVVLDLLLNCWLATAFAERGGFGPSTAVEARRVKLEHLAPIGSLLGLATVLLWVLWFYRVRQNAEAFASEPQRFSRGWAVGAWFTPVAQLYLPKQIANDIWSASLLPDRPPVLSRTLLNSWWGLFCAMFVMGFINVGLEDEAEGGGYASQARAIVADIAFDLLTLPAGVLAILVVLRLTKAQELRAAWQNLSPARPYAGPVYGPR
ncbi:protein kinase domain-containing protein [Streptomyces sp. TP-A0874]|uniref:protein kinase domain-containing protein n=1 Tax=Streptomyces sp. TP-A0874 TaxID=549819 RepID=UPI000852BE59|nr:DUF4328 domain-containing protein [Streptomyces sp. TP-A0874]